MALFNPEDIPTTAIPGKVWDFISGPILSNLPIPGAELLSSLFQFVFGGGESDELAEVDRKLDDVLQQIKNLEATVIEQGQLSAINAGRTKVEDEAVELKRLWGIVYEAHKGKAKITSKFDVALGEIGNASTTGLEARLYRLHAMLVSDGSQAPSIKDKAGDNFGGPLLDAVSRLMNRRLKAKTGDFNYNVLAHDTEARNWLEYARFLMARGTVLLIIYQAFRLVKERTQSTTPNNLAALQNEVAEAIGTLISDYNKRIAEYNDVLLYVKRTYAASYELLLRLAQPQLEGKGPLLVVLDYFDNNSTETRLQMYGNSGSVGGLAHSYRTTTPTFSERFSLRLTDDGTWRLSGSRFLAHPEPFFTGTLQANEDDSTRGLFLDHEVSIKVLPELDAVGTSPCVTLIFIHKDGKNATAYEKFSVTSPSTSNPHPFITDMILSNCSNTLEASPNPPKLRLPLKVGNRSNKNMVFVMHNSRVWTSSRYRALVALDRAVWPVNTTGSINLQQRNSPLDAETYKIQAVVHLRGYQLLAHFDGSDVSQLATQILRDGDQGFLGFNSAYVEAVVDVFIKIWLPGAPSNQNNCMSVWAAEPDKYRFDHNNYDELSVYERASGAVYSTPLDSDWHTGEAGSTFEANGQGLSMKFGINNEWAPDAEAWLDIA